MRLVFHGGKCCGIKTIYGFDSPSTLEPAAIAKPPVGHDVNGQHVYSDLDFFTDAAPPETQKERLDRLIEFCEKKRPKGIIEITLAESPYASPAYTHQVKEWGALLRKRRFKCVNKCVNSNSCNTVHVFHRNSGEVK